MTRLPKKWPSWPELAATIPQMLSFDNCKIILAKGAATPVTHNWLAEAYLLREDYPNAITHLKSVVSP